MEENTFVINVGRQLGSGGKEIGLRLADMFGIQCYDKELLVRASIPTRGKKASVRFSQISYHSSAAAIFTEILSAKRPCLEYKAKR